MLSAPLILIALLSNSVCAAAPYVNADLPPLLEFAGGTPVNTVDEWKARRAEIHQLMLDTFVGTFPKDVPRILSAEVLQQTQPDDGSTRRRIRLTFDTKTKAAFEMWVWVPRGPGPFPLLMTAPRYYQIPWAEEALSRGYMACLYPGVDFMHHEKDYPDYENAWKAFQQNYPDATWTEIACKGWLAGRALDYLLDPESGYEVHPEQIGIIGHSRYGKQSMIATAFDQRFTAVLARSPGSPGSSPYRFTSRHTFNEAPPDFPATWFLDSLKPYYGREHELPIDAHGWYGLIAPRPCLVHTAHQDGCEPTFAVEAAYREGAKVYQLLAQPENLRVSYRPGGHNPITDEHRKQNLDWFDLAFGRGTARHADFPEEFMHDFDFEAWQKSQSAASLTPPPPGSDNRTIIQWALGEAPNTISWDGHHTFISEDDSARMDHDRWAPKNTVRIPVAFGEGIRGNIYHNTEVTKAAPVVIWLHPYSYATGYNEAYGVEGTTIYHRLAQEGYVVLAFDQCGFGLRLLEGRDFYTTFPQWSKLGRMIHDVHAAVDFLLDGKGGAKTEMPPIFKDKVYLVGYSLGGMVGLYAAALDTRVTGVASFCGFTPMRTNTDARLTGGIRRLWKDHALLPKLGLFHGRESDIPYDFDDVLALIAPRPCLVVAPTRDREARIEDIRTCIQPVKSPTLTFEAPDDINRFQRQQQDLFLKWLNKAVEEEQ